MEKTLDYFALSASRIGAYDCPYFFKKKYIEKIKEDRSLLPKSLLMGGLMHTVIERYDKLLMEAKTLSDFEFFKQALDNTWSENQYLPESSYEEIKDILTSFAESHTIDPDVTYGAEVEIALNWDLKEVDWFADDVFLRSKLDRVDIVPDLKLAIITDYKTGFYIPSETDLKRSLQARIYPFAMWCLNNYLERFQVVFHYIRWNVKRTLDFTIEDIRTVEDRLRQFSSMIITRLQDNKTEWIPILGDLCPICQFKCPLAKVEAVEMIQTEIQANAIGNQVYALKRQISSLETKLKAWSKTTDSLIDIGIGTYGWHKSETWKGLQADKLCQYCLSEGLDLNKFLSPDTKKIKKIDDPAVQEAIKSMAKITESVKFGFKEKEEEDAKTL